MKPLSLILGFIPWIAFSFVAHRIAADAVAWSALLGVDADDLLWTPSGEADRRMIAT